MKLTKQQEKDLAALVPAAQQALANEDPVAAQKVAQAIDKIGGTELLTDIWNSGR